MKGKIQELLEDFMKKKFFVMLALACIFSLTACGQKQPAKEESKPAESVEKHENKSEEKDGKIVVTHAFGKTVLDKKPERVACIGWGNQDIALSLGVSPVGMEKVAYGVPKGKEMQTWTEKALKSLDKGEKPAIYDNLDGINFEAIANTKPDVILAGYSGITKEDYNKLSKIAPVIAYPKAPWATFWRDQVKIDAAGLGLAKEGDDLIAKTDDFIKKTIESKPALAGKKVLFMMLNAQDASKFWVFGASDPRAAFMEDLGMTIPESVKSHIKDDAFIAELSTEQADQFKDADMVVIYGNDKTLGQLQADPLISKIPAVKNGAVAVIPDATPLAASCIPTPLSIQETLADYVKILDEAAQKSK